LVSAVVQSSSGTAASRHRQRLGAYLLLALAGTVAAADRSQYAYAQPLPQGAEDGAQAGTADRASAALLAARPALIAAGDAESLAAAALLTEKSDPSGRLTLASRAAARAPKLPELVWLQLQSCIAVATCDVRPIEAHLHRLDPGNGAAWSGSLARSADDTVARRGIIATIAAAERFDIYWNSLVVHTANALMRSGAMEAPNALITAIGLGAAQAIPAYQTLSAGCKDAAPEQPDALARCRRLATVLRKGDTYLTEMLGLSIARRLFPEGSAEYQEVVDARRVARYRMDAATKINGDLEGAEGSRRYLELLATHRTEQEAFLAEIAQAGLDPNPGPGWQESD
jgi:hypothetical protein